MAAPPPPPPQLLQQFPPEVWGNILGRLERRDVRNLFVAFPALGGRVEGRPARVPNNPFEGRVEQVVPFILPYLGRNDVANSRLVSRRWADEFPR